MAILMSLTTVILFLAAQKLPVQVQTLSSVQSISHMLAPLCKRSTNLLRFNFRSYYGEIVQLQFALNDDYNKVLGKSNTYHISELIIRRLFSRTYASSFTSEQFHWFNPLCKETLQHFARFRRLFRSIMCSILVPFLPLLSLSLLL